MACIRAIGIVSLTLAAGTPAAHAALLAVNPTTDEVERYNSSNGTFQGIFASPAAATGTVGALSLGFGPDGNLYVGAGISDDVLRFNGQTGSFLGTFVSSGSGGIANGTGPALLFGRDGHLYLTDDGSDAVRRYDGSTGAYIDTFVTQASGGLDQPVDMQFGPDGDLFVLTRAAFEDAEGPPSASSRVYRYDGSTGAFKNIFTTGGPASTFGANFMTFAFDGDLFLSSWTTDEVLRFDGESGAFEGSFLSAGYAGLHGLADIVFGPDGLLYVASGNFSNEPSGQILRFDSGGRYVDTFVNSPGRALRGHFLVTPAPTGILLLATAMSVLSAFAGRCARRRPVLSQF